MRWCATFLCFFLTACGGSRPTAEEVLAKPPDPFADQVRSLVERCAVPDLERLFALLDVFDDLLDPAVQDPPLTFQGLRILDGCIDWTLDSDADGTDDMAGHFCFEDASGTPIFPFNPLNLGGGVAEVADLLATLPDGTRVIVGFTQDGIGAGSMTVPFQGGQPQSGSGTVTYTHDDCTTVYGFSDVLVANLLTDYPNALVTLALDTPSESAQGTVTMNGTPTAVLSVTKDARVIVFTVDLDTFELRGFQDPLTP